MPMVQSNGIEICYESFGEKENPAVLLIAMYATQMLVWPETLCEALAARGFYVIRFDNRDIGLSTKFEDAGLPDLMKIISIPVAERVALVPYLLEDMARDAVGLLDALEIDAAHIVGASMGGMIGQIIAGQFAERALSLTSIMSTPDVAKSPPVPEEMAVSGGAAGTAGTGGGFAPSSAEEARIWNFMDGWRAIGSEAFGPSEAELRDFAVRCLQRSHYPQGPARQIAAIQASPGREELLADLKIPVLVIHGTQDPFIPLIGGELTAQAIPDAEFIAIEGMGHELFGPAAKVLETMIGNHIEKVARA